MPRSTDADSLGRATAVEPLAMAGGSHQWMVDQVADESGGVRFGVGLSTFPGKDAI